MSEILCESGLHSHLSVQNQEITRLLLFNIGEATSPSGCSIWRENVLRGERWAWWWILTQARWQQVHILTVVIGGWWCKIWYENLGIEGIHRQTDFISGERWSRNWATLELFTNGQTGWWSRQMMNAWPSQQGRKGRACVVFVLQDLVADGNWEGGKEDVSGNVPFSQLHLAQGCIWVAVVLFFISLIQPIVISSQIT